MVTVWFCLDLSVKTEQQQEEERKKNVTLPKRINFKAPFIPINTFDGIVRTAFSLAIVLVTRIVAVRSRTCARPLSPNDVGSIFSPIFFLFCCPSSAPLIRHYFYLYSMACIAAGLFRIFLCYVFRNISKAVQISIMYSKQYTNQRGNQKKRNVKNYNTNPNSNSRI